MPVQLDQQPARRDDLLEDRGGHQRQGVVVAARLVVGGALRGRPPGSSTGGAGSCRRTRPILPWWSAGVGRDAVPPAARPGSHAISRPPHGRRTCPAAPPAAARQPMTGFCPPHRPDLLPRAGARERPPRHRGRPRRGRWPAGRAGLRAGEQVLHHAGDRRLAGVVGPLAQPARRACRQVKSANGADTIAGGSTGR